MNDKNERKLGDFLDEKLRKIYMETRGDNPRFDISRIKTENVSDKHFVATGYFNYAL